MSIFKCQSKLRGLLLAEKVEWMDGEKVIYGRGIDGKYYKATLFGERYKRWVMWESAKVEEYTGCFDSGPGGYGREDYMSMDEWKVFKKTVKWTEEEDEAIYGEKMGLITRVFGSLLTGQSVSPEDLDRL